jgi:coenzyme F420 hydrogenase subunit beta
MGCGTCESVCPIHAIRINRDYKKGLYFPSISCEQCTSCGNCLEICPGNGVEFDLCREKFLSNKKPDKMLGSFEICYIGYSNNSEIRHNSASGGLVTSLLVYLLETKKINGALVLGMSNMNSLEPNVFIATSPHQIISASGSKYCPSPNNKGLRNILNTDGHFVVVGLPCQIHAVRKFELNNEKLQDKILFHFGLFCGNNVSFKGTEYFLRNNNISTKNVSGIRYRGEGWPGKIVITTKEERKFIIPRATTENIWYRKALFASAFHYDFMIPRCLLCPDLVNELADISFGDPWLKEYKEKEKIGQSLIISRNTKGNKLIKEAISAGVVVLNEISVEKVRKAQNFSFKAGVGGRIFLRKIFRLAVPEFQGKDLTFRKRSLFSFFRYLPSYFSFREWTWMLLRVNAISYYLWGIFKRKIKRVVKWGIKTFIRV